jgi:hypothetical protein
MVASKLVGNNMLDSPHLTFKSFSRRSYPDHHLNKPAAGKVFTTVVSYSYLLNVVQLIFVCWLVIFIKADAFSFQANLQKPNVRNVR